MARSSDMNQPRISDKAETQVRTTASETRPGPLGRPVAIVLGCALVLALVAWGALELWGESQDDAADVASAAQTSAPSTTPPSEQPFQQPAPTDNAPTTAPATGGNTAPPAPAGTQPSTAPQQ